MGHLLELLWRLLDILSHSWDLVVNWRLWVCILLALGRGVGRAPLGCRQTTAASSSPLASDWSSRVGVAWELLSAAARRG